MKTPEQILKEMIGDYTFQIAQLLSQISVLTDEKQKLTEENKKLNEILTGGSGDEKK